MRRVCAYFLERSLGRLVTRAGDGDGSVRRFDARASDGAVALDDVELDAEAVSAYAGETLARAGVTLVSARCGKITGRIPWEAIGRDSCSLELEDVALVVRRRVDVGETPRASEEEEEEGEGDDESGDERSSMIMRRVLSALARGLRGRAREVTVVVQDASGAGKFLLRAASFEYTHGKGATFEGLSARKISTGVGCSTSEVIVGDVRGAMEVSSDFTRVDVALDEVVASASMATTTTLAEFMERRRGDSARESRVKTATATQPRRSFIRDVLLSSDLASSVYEEATESMEESAYEDAEEFFDADEAIRELGRSMDFSTALDDDVETPRGGFVCVVRCPKVTVDVPFDESVTRATITNARVVVDERATVAFDDATCTYGYDETHTVQLRARGGEATSRDDRVAVRVDGLVVAVDGVERARADGGVDAEAFFLEDAGRPLDGSLPNACVAEIEAVTSSLRERLANDANVYVKASAPSVAVVVNADAVDAVGDVAASAYELPESHPLALRAVTPDSVLNPLVIALDVDRVDVELTRSTREEEEKQTSRVTLGIERVSAFAATNVAGDLGSDFVWMRFEDARVCVDGVDVASVRGVDGRDASTLAFARAAGERSRADARVVGAAVSATECEPLVRRLNTFLSVPDDGDGHGGGDDDGGGVAVTVRVVDAALVYKSNASFGVLSADFLRISSADARASDDVDDDARDLSTDRGVEIHCGDIVGFVAPPDVDDVGGLCRLRAFPFARESLRTARFAPAFRAEAVSLHTMASRARTAIATVCADTCAVSLHVDTLRALRRLSATDIDAFVSDDGENDENEYVFVSPVKKPRDVSRASYGSNVTRSVIEDATRDHELFPKPVRGERNVRGERRRSTPLRERGGGPNVIENFFYRDTRRARRGATRAPMFASGSVTSARRRHSARARVRGLDASMMPRRRFAADFIELPPPPPVAARRSTARRRYLPLPADAVVPRSTIHVNTDAVEISFLPGSYWSETPAGVPRHADSVARDPSGSSAGVSLSFRTNAVRVDTFPTESSEVAHCLAVSVREVSCVDTTPGATWPNVAKRAAGAGEETDACALDVAAVRPDPNVPEELEYTVRASMVPLHVKLDQRVLKLITDVFASDASSTACAPPPSADATYFQKIEIGRTSLRLDYCGRQVDVESLRSGNLIEALNLIPWDGVSLDVQPLRLVGVLGVAAAARSVLQSWLDDVTHTQAHKFVQGVKPIKSAVEIGRRAADVVSKPLEYHRDKRRGGGVAGFALGVAAFVREVSLSSVELGAFAANKSAALLAAAEAMIAEHAERAETETENPDADADAATDPTDIFQGLSLARRAAFSGARRAAAAVVIDPIRDYAAGQTSSSDAISRAVRRVPFAAVTGAKGCARAVDAALSGAAKSLRADSAVDVVVDSESTVVVDARREPA